MNDYGIAVMFCGWATQFAKTKTQADTGYEFVTFLRNEFGAGVLGNGYFGAVVAHPTDTAKIVKIGVHNARYYDFNDMDADGYLSFLLFCVRNPHPNLPVINAVYVDYTNQTYAVVMERLVHRDVHSILSHEQEEASYKVFNNVPGLRAALGDPTDLHSGNSMYRADGTLVLLDPFTRLRRLPSSEYLVSTYKDKKIHVELTRPVVAAKSESTDDQHKEKDRVLCAKLSLDVNRMFQQGLEGALLPVRNLQLRSKKRAIDITRNRAVERRTEAIFRANPWFIAGAGLEFAKGRDICHPTVRSKVVPNGGRGIGLSAILRVRVQPYSIEGHRARLRDAKLQRKVGLLTPKEYRRIKAEVYRALFKGKN